MVKLSADGSNEIIRAAFVIAGAFGIFQFFTELFVGQAWFGKISAILYPAIIFGGLMIKTTGKFKFFKKVGKVAVIATGSWGVFYLVMSKLQSIPFYNSYSLGIHIILLAIGIWWIEVKNGKEV